MHWTDSCKHADIPISPGSLWRKLHAVYAVVVVVHDLRQTEVRDFDFPTCRAVHQQDVTYMQAKKLGYMVSQIIIYDTSVNQTISVTMVTVGSILWQYVSL